MKNRFILLKILIFVCVVFFGKFSIGQYETNATKVEDLKFDDEIYTAPAMDSILSDFSKGSGFPLTNDVDFANFGASNVNYLALNNLNALEEYPTNSLYLDSDGKLMFSGVGINTNEGSGTVKELWGPVSFTNQDTFVSATNVERIGLSTVSNANMAIQFDPETGTYEFKAIAGIPGPPGADGIGNVEWAGTFYSGMMITNENTWVSWNGSIWTCPTSSLPIFEPPTNTSSFWTLVVSKGADGKSGKDGKDGLGLELTTWSTNLDYISPDMLLSYAGYLLVITNDTTIQNPGQPVVNGSVQKQYKALVWPGANGASADVYTNAMFIIDFNPLDAVPAHSLVVYNGYLWYAKQDYNPTNGTAIPPSEGPNWTVIGKQGLRGPQGANGVGNLQYVGAWDPLRTNSLNDIVRWTRPDGKINWYRATKDNFVSGNNPYANTNFWDLEISSGTDANVLNWKIVDGTYDPSIGHSNELYRAPNGIVYYTIGDVLPGEIYGPGASQGNNWNVFVRDGTTLTGITNGTTILVWRGIWNTSETYNPGDLVTFDNNGSHGLYVNKLSCNSTNPLYQDYWIPIATGIQGARGPQGVKGEDGAVTYVTNITTYTYTNCSFITNITYITNDTKTAIFNANSGDLIPSARFSTDDFTYGNGMFSLTESALGVKMLNGLRGNLNIIGSNNTSVSKSSGNIIVSSTIPIGLNKGTNSFNGSTMNVTKLLFNSDSGFRFVTNETDDIVISLGSAWTTLYDDNLNTNSPSGEEPLRITTHTNDNKVLWVDDTKIVTTNSGIITTNSIKTISIGTSGEKGEQGEQGPVGPAGTNAVMIIGSVTNVDPISSNEFGQAFVNITNEPNNVYSLHFGIPSGLKGETGSKGDKGDNGAILVPKGMYNSTNTYYLNEMVRYENAEYYVTNDNNGQGILGIIPTEVGNTNWFMFVQDGEGIAVNATTLFAFDSQNEPIYYATNLLIDTNALNVVQTNINTNTYQMLTSINSGSSGNFNNRIVTETTNYVSTDDYLLWMNGTTNQILILTTLTNDFKSIIVRTLSNIYNTEIQFPETNSIPITLFGPGDWVSIDYVNGFGWYVR